MRDGRPLIGITMGDPAGIGAEVIVKAVSSQQSCKDADFLIIGSEPVISRAAEICNISFDYEIVDNIAPLSLNRGSGRRNSPEFVRGWIGDMQPRIPASKIALLPMNNLALEGLANNRPTMEGGRASIEYILKGIDLAINNVVDCLVTAPINKEAIAMAGFKYPGHTELLKEQTDSEKAVMLMVGGGLRVSFLTSHVPLKRVTGLINIDDLLSTIMITSHGLKRYFSIDDPRVAVCGLNPHAGEGGRFGGEEMDVVAPSVREAREKGVKCVGPVPADVAFYKAIKGEYDVVVALYHDQGSIPLKLLAFESGVNITLGIPIIRTSPDHGTAYDIAWKGIADPGSMIEAIRIGAMMASK